MSKDIIEILIHGFAQQKEDGRWNATSTTVLVQSIGKLVLVDPGLNPGSLKAALSDRRLDLDDIDIVLVTHSHFDHSRNNRLFDKSKICNIFKHFAVPGLPLDELLVPSTSITALRTPGHADQHVSFLVETESGKYAIAGDVFWWPDDQVPGLDIPSLIDKEDPAARNQDNLRISRQKLINAADFIIPGHGKPFTVSH